ncbi:hypothetical protein RCCGE510_02953 [Rhizobium sp. CCGE 510]|nr:hypothetical protein RCCGE510_02953 [Rhizobium sp. CCGE 510]
MLCFPLVSSGSSTTAVSVRRRAAPSSDQRKSEDRFTVECMMRSSCLQMGLATALSMAAGDEVRSDKRARPIRCDKQPTNRGGRFQVHSLRPAEKPAASRLFFWIRAVRPR